MDLAAAGPVPRKGLGRHLVPWAVYAAIGATLVGGWIWIGFGHSLGSGLPPFTVHWHPAVSPFALLGVPALAAAILVAIPLWRSDLGPTAFGLAVAGLTLVARLALNMVRAGPHDWYAVFVVQPVTGEGRHEYLPGLDALRGGVGHFLASFDTIEPSLPTHPSGHPPGTLLMLHVLAIDTPQGMAALTIGIGALATPLLYLLARRLFEESRARMAAILFVFSPAGLLYGATSADAMYATLGVAAAAALVARGTAVRALGGALLAVASFFSWALLAVGVWAVALTERREGLRRALALAGICALAVLGFYLALHALTGFDAPAALRATHDHYYAGIGGRRPYAYWLLGSPAAFLVAAGLPVTWQAARSLSRGEITAVALAVVIGLSAITGYTKAETERIWLFLVPLACLAAAASQPAAGLRRTLVLLGVQAVAVELLLNTIW